MKTNRALGSDRCPSEVIKEVASIAPSGLVEGFNKLLASQEF